MRTSLIVAAGGSGLRFRNSLSQKNKLSSKTGPRSKLFFSLGGKPLLARTLAAFEKIPQIRETVLTYSNGAKEDFRHLVHAASRGRLGRLPRRVRLVAGGKTRAESVWNALRKSDPKNDWVLVHDGARPLIRPEVIRKLFRSVKGADAGAVLGKKVVPTIKQILGRDGNIGRTLDRRFLFEAETPQLVRRRLLKRAYAENPDAFGATDEASLLESIHARVRAVPHETWNPKITTAEDLKLAEAYLNVGARHALPLHVGLGRDTHRLVKGRRFCLGGVRTPFDKGPLGHSDGDALLHSIADAILGAIGAGDIGDWFSDKNPRLKNIRSSKILASVLAESRKRGWVPAQVDTVIHLEKPKLGPRKAAIRRNVARLLHLAAADVSIKAKTMEGIGPVGEGLAFSCEALVTVKRVFQ